MLNLAMLKEVKQDPGSTPEVNGIYSGLRPILHPSFFEIRKVVFV